MCVCRHRINCFLFVLLFLFSCVRQPEKADTVPDNSIEVSVARVTREKFLEDFNTFGTITYNIKNSVTCLQSGQLYYFPFKEGDYIKRGQVIARLKNVQLEFQKEQYENALTSAQSALAVTKNELREQELSVEKRLLSLEKSKLTIAQKEVELEFEQETLKSKTELHALGGVTDLALKQMQLAEKSSITDISILKKELEIAMLGLRDEDLLDAGLYVPSNFEDKKKLLIELNTRSVLTQIKARESEVRNAQTSLRSVNKLIEELTVVSPISGVLGAKTYACGEFVKENETIATMIDISTVYAVIYIQEKDIVNYSIGSDIDIYIPSLKQSINTVISDISPIADPQSGNFSIKARLVNTKQKIKPGMFIKCCIKQQNDIEYCKIPESCFASKDEGIGTVFVVTNGYAVLKRIEVKSIRDGFIWIKSGVLENDVVIMNPSPFLREGQRVSY